MQLKNKCLGIHELNNTVIDLINNNYDENILLTFDDGIYSQFKYKDRIKNRNRIYFICPNLINTKEINEKTLESKLVKNLYFCGEILDVDGDCGGFNLQWAWASGVIAAKSASCK